MIKLQDSYRLVKISRVVTQGLGALQYFEGNHDIPFSIERIYYITEVPVGNWRGGHAHKNLRQLIFCPYGNVVLHLSNGTETVDISLDKPNLGVIITESLWRDTYWKTDNSILCVAASDYYNEDDYIRDYDEYKIYTGANYRKNK